MQKRSLRTENVYRGDRTVRKSLFILLLVGLLAGALAAGPAEAAKKKKKKKKNQRVERVIETSYTFPSAIGIGGAGACSGCVQLATGPNELYVKIEMVDDNLPVPGADISWDTNDDGITDTGFTVCGATEEAEAIPPGVTLVAFTWPVTGPGCPGGGATSGTIKATFSNLP